MKARGFTWEDWEEHLLRDLAEECVEQARNEEEANADHPAEAKSDEDLMSAEEVCKELKFSLSTLRRNTKGRKLAYIKRDGRLKFRRADVERYDQTLHSGKLKIRHNARHS